MTLIHPSHTPHAPLTHPSHTPHTPITHPSYNPHTPITHPSHTPHTPLIHPSYTPHAPLMHPSYTPHTPRIHPSDDVAGNICQGPGHVPPPSRSRPPNIPPSPSSHHCAFAVRLRGTQGAGVFLVSQAAQRQGVFFVCCFFSAACGVCWSERAQGPAIGAEHRQQQQQQQQHAR